MDDWTSTLVSPGRGVSVLVASATAPGTYSRSLSARSWIDQGLITALTVGVVLGVRPDMVYGAQDLLPSLELREGSALAGRS